MTYQYYFDKLESEKRQLEEQNTELRRVLVKTLTTLEYFVPDANKHSVFLAARAVLDKQVG